MVVGSKYVVDKFCKICFNNNKIGVCEMINVIELSIFNIRFVFVILIWFILLDNFFVMIINIFVKSDVRLIVILIIFIFIW